MSIKCLRIINQAPSHVYYSWAASWLMSTWVHQSSEIKIYLTDELGIYFLIHDSHSCITSKTIILSGSLSFSARNNIIAFVCIPIRLFFNSLKILNKIFIKIKHFRFDRTIFGFVFSVTLPVEKQTIWTLPRIIKLSCDDHQGNRLYLAEFDMVAFVFINKTQANLF